MGSEYKKQKEWIPPAEKPFKCDEPGCNKTFLNKNGWLYHTRVWKGKCGQQDDSNYPYKCYDQEMCGKKYRAIAGLRYHYKSSGDHGAIGYQMLLDGDHPEIDKSIKWPPLQQTQPKKASAGGRRQKRDRDEEDDDDQDGMDDDTYQQPYYQQQTYYQPVVQQQVQPPQLLDAVTPTPPSSTFMTPSTSTEGIHAAYTTLQHRVSTRPLRQAVVQTQTRKPPPAPAVQEGFFVDAATAQSTPVQHMIVPPTGETHAPLPYDLLQAVTMASNSGSPGTASNSGTPAKIAAATKQPSGPAPPLTFGARSQRFNPYASSSAKGYYYASPAPPRAPRLRRQSF